MCKGAAASWLTTALGESHQMKDTIPTSSPGPSVEWCVQVYVPVPVCAEVCACVQVCGCACEDACACTGMRACAGVSHGGRERVDATWPVVEKGLPAQGEPSGAERGDMGQLRPCQPAKGLVPLTNPTIPGTTSRTRAQTLTLSTEHRSII